MLRNKLNLFIFKNDFNILLTSNIYKRFLNQNLHEAKNNNKLMELIPECQTKLLKVVVIGMPNAGKSTLINSLIDRRVCPASNKVHTTRKRTHAIFTEGETQIIFLDTPGIVSNAEVRKYNLEKSFTKDGRKSLNEADIIGVIQDVGNTWTRERLDIKLIKLLEVHSKKPNFLILNKIDMLKSKRKLLDITKMLTEGCINKIPFDKRGKDITRKGNGWPNFSEVFMTSALNSDGVEHIKKYLINQAQPGKWLYPAEQWTDHTPEDIILRTVQATLLDFLPQEIPYKLKSNLEVFEQLDRGISTVVVVQCVNERIRNLVVGVGDGKLRQITEKAQRDLLNTFDQPVRLHIIVKNEK